MTQAFKFETALISRLNELIAQAGVVLATHTPNPPNIMGRATLDTEKFQQWKSSSENIIQIICGTNSNYLTNFTAATKRGGYKGSVSAGNGVLLAIKEDAEAGLITTVKSLAVAEVLVDFIEMAEHLLTQGYKDPAASLAGAVLEDALRKIAENNDVAIKSSDDISSLNNKLADQRVYNRIVQKQIHAWKAIRDAADHGKFNEYTRDDVADMLKGITRFMAEHQR